MRVKSSVFAAGTGYCKDGLPKRDRLFWKTINEAFTSIQGLTALDWVYNNDESDPLLNEILDQGNIDKCLLSALPPWKIPLILMWKSNLNLGGVI